MDTSAFWIIVLTLWIWVLQNRIKELEKRVESLLSRKDAQASLAPQEASTAEVQREIPKPEASVTERKSETGTVQEEERAVAVFKDSHAQDVSKEPSLLFSWLTHYFGGGNLLVRIGGVILFFGLAFLVKYAAAHIEVSIGVRLVSIALFGVALCIIGWRLRQREGAYGQVLQGVGVAVLYLVIYGASKIYALLSLDIAFMMMFAVVILGTILAAIQSSLPLAIFSIGGGFLAPILTSSENGSHVILFSYYLILNLGIFALSWLKSWRVLNIVGFVFTFVIATAWGVLRYKADYFSTTEPFLIAFFAIYLAVSIIFTFRHTFEPKNYVDSILVFGLPIVVFPIQIYLVQNFNYGDAISAVALGLIYLALWYILKAKERAKLLAQSFCALGVIFLTISIPYIFDANVTSALWAIEGAGVVWLSLKQNRIYSRLFGLFVIVLSVANYLLDYRLTAISLTNYFVAIIIVISLFVVSFFLDKYKNQIFVFEKYIGLTFSFIASLLFFTWTIRYLNSVYKFKNIEVLSTTILIAFAVLYVANRFVKWDRLVTIMALMFPLLLGLLLEAYLNATTIASFEIYHYFPFYGLGAVLYPGLVILMYRFLKVYGGELNYAKWLHLIALVFVVLLFTAQIYTVGIENFSDNLTKTLLVLPSLIFGFLLISKMPYRGWFGEHKLTYRFFGVATLSIFATAWTLYSLHLEASVSYYLPLLNILDILEIAAIALFLLWLYANKERLSRQPLYIALGGAMVMSIVVTTAIYARVVSHYLHIDYSIGSLWHSGYFQTGISIIWSILAIVLMLLSKRYISRELWIAGFGLLLVVVAKLFFVELAHSGTIERIVSFIVVGALLLLIGYFVPIPPNQEEESSDE